MRRTIALTTLLSLPLPLAAQGPGAPARCDGERVTSIEVRPLRPPFGGMAARWQSAARGVGLHHATTQSHVIESFLALEVGQPCTEVRRAESERILRAQPFLADATVRAAPDGAGGVAVVVETVDEIPVLANARFHGLTPRAFSLGNGNVGGEGLLLEARVERGFTYRTGIGGRLIQYSTFGHPYVATLDGERQTLGYFFNTSLEHLFYTDLQRVAWHAGFTTSHSYPRIIRPARDELALGVEQQRWDASSFARVFGTRTVALLGLGASGLRLTPDSMGIVVADTGVARDSGTTLHDRYMPFRTARIGVLGGIRRVTFHTVRGFDALEAQQDVASGAAAGLFVAHGISAFGENDLYLSSAAYAGVAREHALLASLVQVEGRKGPGAGEWDSVIGSGRSALYLARPGLAFLLDDQYSSGTRSRLPLQLAMGDWQGGILGYHNSGLAGARRNVARTELRWSRAALVQGTDVGVATFGQLGSIWAGDAPYGSTATRATVGISLLAAYPSRSKRVYRADIGFPLTRSGQGGGRIEVRFTSEDRTVFFWREPDDVARARTGAGPASLFAWPAH